MTGPGTPPPRCRWWTADSEALFNLFTEIKLGAAALGFINLAGGFRDVKYGEVVNGGVWVCVVRVWKVVRCGEEERGGVVR